MKNTHIIIVVIVLIAGALFVFNSKKSEAPMSGDNQGVVDGGGVPVVDTPTPTSPIGGGAICTEEAKLCPDGSAVGRTGPQCEFEACPSASGTQAVKEFIVTGKNFSFSPDVISVKKGDRVKITFKNTAGFHDFVIDEFGAATKQGQAPFEEVLEFTANKTGSFEYYCSVGSHRIMGMKGILKVE